MAGNYPYLAEMLVENAQAWQKKRRGKKRKTLRDSFKLVINFHQRKTGKRPATMNVTR